MSSPDTTPIDSRRVVLLDAAVVRLAGEIVEYGNEPFWANFLASEVLAGLQEEPVLSWTAEYLHADDITSSLDTPVRAHFERLHQSTVDDLYNHGTTVIGRDRSVDL